MFNQVYIPTCTQCNKEGRHTKSTNIPKEWIGILQESAAEIKYINSGKTNAVSTSCYLAKDSLFCSFDCFESFMNTKIKSMKNAPRDGNSTKNTVSEGE